MSSDQNSPLKTWGIVLGFLAGLMLVLGVVAYLTRSMAGAHKLARSQTEVRH